MNTTDFTVGLNSNSQCATPTMNILILVFTGLNILISTLKQIFNSRKALQPVKLISDLKAEMTNLKLSLSAPSAQKQPDRVIPIPEELNVTPAPARI